MGKKSLIHRKDRSRILSITALALIFLLFSMNVAAFAEQSMQPMASDTSLQKKITEAKSVKGQVHASTNGSDVSDKEMWAPQTAFNALQASIDEAEGVLKDPEKTDAMVDKQVGLLTSAISLFKGTWKNGTKTSETEKPAEWVNRIYLENDELDEDGRRHFVGEDSYPAYKTLSITEKGKTVQLNGYYTTNKGGSKKYQTADSGSPMGAVKLSWRSSDNSIATVSPSGYITPIKDGKVTITAIVAEDIKCNGTPPSKSVTVDVSGQSGKYVSKVQIIDKDGKSLSLKDREEATIINKKNTYFNFYALVTWHDPKTGKDKVEDTRKVKVSSTIKWSVGGSDIAGTINKDTGRFKSSAYSANCYVRCTVTGGKGGKDVEDVANVQVDTGKYKYNPAKSLTLKVVYDKSTKKAKNKKGKTYSLSSLNSLPKKTATYTVIGGKGYGTIKARGYDFKQLLIEKAGIKSDRLGDIQRFEFQTSDGYNNPISYDTLFGPSRYYFPELDANNWSNGIPVQPVLATESSLEWSKAEISPNTSMDANNRFRLVFGATRGGGEKNSPYQIYYIRGITIKMKGAPPATKGEGPGNGNGGQAGENSGSGNGIGNGTGNGIGSGSGDGNGDGSGGGNAAGIGNKKKGSGKDGGGSKKSGKAGNTDSDKAGGNYTVFEMMGKKNADVEPYDTDLPYLPAAIPIAFGGFSAGGITCLIGFKRRIS